MAANARPHGVPVRESEGESEGQHRAHPRLRPDDETLAFDTQGGKHREWFCFTGNEWRPGRPPRPPPLPPASGPFDPQEVPAGHEPALAIMAGQLRPSDWGSLRADADVLRHSMRELQASHPNVARHWPSAAFTCARRDQGPSVTTVRRAPHRAGLCQPSRVTFRSATSCERTRSSQAQARGASATTERELGFPTGSWRP